MLTVHDFQTQQIAWARKNFGKAYDYQPLLGMIEELGELAHALLKGLQGIRGTAAEHEEAGKDAVADVLVYLTQYCSEKEWALDEIVGATTFEELQAAQKDLGFVLGQTVPPCVRLVLEACTALGKVSAAECNGDSQGGKLAVAGTLSKIASYCAVRSWDLQKIVEDTWAVVSKRDWTKNRQTGQVTP